MKPEDFRETYGPTALVAGASCGMALAIAEELAARGFDLVLTAWHTDHLDALAQRLLSSCAVRTRVIGIALTHPGAPGRLLAETEGTDIGLVIIDADDNPAHGNAAMELAHGFIPRLTARGKGGLLFTAAAEGPIAAQGERLWSELQGTGIDVLTLCPGVLEPEEAAAGATDLRAAAERARIALDGLRHGPRLMPRPQDRETA